VDSFFSLGMTLGSVHWQLLLRLLTVFIGNSSEPYPFGLTHTCSCASRIEYRAPRARVAVTFSNVQPFDKRKALRVELADIWDELRSEK
jgi:hypothetical protein